MKTKVRILLDLDEVLADFIGSACRVHGSSREQLNAIFGEWWGGNKFWNPIHRYGEVFWSDLDPLPWARALVEEVQSLTDDWHIVTAPNLAEWSYSGKVKWLKKFFGREFDRFAITPHKHIFAGPNAILIDDRLVTVEAFVNAGGKGILFPRPRNCQHETITANPLVHVIPILRSLCT